MDSNPAEPDTPPSPAKGGPGKPGGKPRVSNPGFMLLLVMIIGMMIFYYVVDATGRQQVSYGLFLEQLDAGNVAEARIDDDMILFSYDGNQPKQQTIHDELPKPAHQIA